MQAATGSPAFRTDADGCDGGGRYHVSTTTGAATFPVVHNTTARRFEITLDGQTAYSKYLLA